jgi:hypothetical protein
MCGRSLNFSAGAVRRFGPIVMPGKRIPTRGKRTGSVSIVRPKKFMRTVECPSHASVTCVSRHFDGSGLAKAGAIGRQLSTVHSLKRCPSQRRAREAGGFGCSGVFMVRRDTPFRSRVSRLGSLQDPLAGVSHRRLQLRINIRLPFRLCVIRWRRRKHVGRHAFRL